LDTDQPPVLGYKDIVPGYEEFEKAKKKRIRAKCKNQLREANEKALKEW